MIRVVLSVILLSSVLSAPAEAMSRKPETFPVEMKVDFGPAQKAGFSETLIVEKGTTPKEAVSQVFPVLSGMACCSLREVLEIGGVKIDPARNRWWVCRLNGSSNVKPYKTRLKPGDVVEWVYVEEAQ